MLIPFGNKHESGFIIEVSCIQQFPAKAQTSLLPADYEKRQVSVSSLLSQYAPRNTALIPTRIRLVTCRRELAHASRLPTTTPRIPFQDPPLFTGCSRDKSVAFLPASTLRRCNHRQPPKAFNDHARCRRGDLLTFTRRLRQLADRVFSLVITSRG